VRHNTSDELAVRHCQADSLGALPRRIASDGRAIASTINANLMHDQPRFLDHSLDMLAGVASSRATKGRLSFVSASRQTSLKSPACQHEVVEATQMGLRGQRHADLPLAWRPVCRRGLRPRMVNSSGTAIAAIVGLLITGRPALLSPVSDPCLGSRPSARVWGWNVHFLGHHEPSVMGAP